MRIYNNHIPTDSFLKKDSIQTGNPHICSRISSGFINAVKTAQIIPEQMINETVNVYEEAIPYIKCEIKSTIQHEAGHRQDEQNRQQSLERGEEVMGFEDFTSEGRAEGIAEKEEENCDPPSEVSGKVVSINLNQLFEESRSAAAIPMEYIQDVKAGTLDPAAQGMYLMQDFSDQIDVKHGQTSNAYEGFDGTLWVDVRKIVEPFIAPSQSIWTQPQIRPSTFQDDGVQPDLPGISQEAPFVGSVPAVQSVPSVPSVGAR